jgi:phage-related protein
VHFSAEALFLMEEQGADLLLPHARAMGDGLFELRCKGEEGIGRAFYCTLVGRQILILHRFIKKANAIPLLGSPTHFPPSPRNGTAGWANTAG